ncbi:hypothetical protein MKZ08_06680 [Viridibacillus sp. FSL R5-0477]|uniref:Lipoprotein n=1 Tax=Viridibacillus arenosi FSL R5-213 TaxID=1227360 RepID=W4ENV0_9BACL|nr:hypothetical protein [Viridibacillus arenosi]ETT82255.1 hypothetical protein C176_14732 [Viridibacillus arenosi FSL R5-213]OMC92641.1 hypothetical protein BK137_06265 [Viridibacillus arenosi]
MKNGFFALIILSAFLVGCNSNESASDSASASIIDLTTYPLGVQNGTVSPEFYNELNQWITNFSPNFKTITDIILEYRNDNSYLEDEKNKQNLLNAINECKTLMDEFDMSVDTEADDVLRKAVIDFSVSQDLIFEYLDSFITKNDYDYMKLAGDESKSLGNKSQHIADLCDKYGL